MSIQPKSIFISIQSHLDKFNSIWKESKIHTRVNLVNLNSSSTDTLTICYLSVILSIHSILDQSKRRAWTQQEMTIWIFWHCHLFSILLLILSFKYHSIPIMRATWFKRLFLFNQTRKRWFDRTTRLQTSSSFFHRNEIVELREMTIFAISVIEELLICIWIEYCIFNYFYILNSW